MDRAHQITVFNIRKQALKTDSKEKQTESYHCSFCLQGQCRQLREYGFHAKQNSFPELTGTIGKAEMAESCTAELQTAEEKQEKTSRNLHMYRLKQGGKRVIPRAESPGTKLKPARGEGHC